MKRFRIEFALILYFAIVSCCSAAQTATAVATVTLGLVSGIRVTSAGEGYVVEPTVTITGGGGSGATARAILTGDKVSAIIVLTAGSGYTSFPRITIKPPIINLDLTMELVPRVIIDQPFGEFVNVESSETPSGPWTAWRNVQAGRDGILLVDLPAIRTRRFYRAFADVRLASEGRPAGPQDFVWIEPGYLLPRGFWLSDHEVTQGEWEKLMGFNPSLFKGNTNNPVEQVTWDDAISFCKKLTDRERAAGRITTNQAYRLPTEAEWEYAARAGTTGATDGDLRSIAWYNDRSPSSRSTKPVKQKDPNAWGLYDMIGNVWEWCSDPFQQNDRTRVLRGGSIFSDPESCTSAVRSSLDPQLTNAGSGFRVALSQVW
jgi:hypothetical protein